jgi:hypothetical protein
MRKAGKTFKEIAIEYNISPGRVRAIFIEMERTLKLEADPLYQLVQNKYDYMALHRANIKTVDELKRYVDSYNTPPKHMTMHIYNRITSNL